MAAFRELEKLVATIQQQLAPEAEVTHNVRMLGRRSKVMRQIDVLMRQQVGQHEINIIIDSKDHARPVDVIAVEEFHMLLEDVGAHKGVLVAPKGFTSTAKTRATDLLMSLYTPVDTGDHKWKVNPYLRTICDFRTPIFSFNLSTTGGYPFRLAQDFYNSLMARDASGIELGRPLETAMRAWNDGKFPLDAGEYLELNLYPASHVWVDNGFNMRVPVAITANLQVTATLHLGQICIEQISGFKDELKDGVITRGFTTGPVNLDEAEAKWQRITTLEEVPGPALRIIGVNGWRMAA